MIIIEKEEQWPPPFKNAGNQTSSHCANRKGEKSPARRKRNTWNKALEKLMQVSGYQ